MWDSSFQLTDISLSGRVGILPKEGVQRIIKWFLCLVTLKEIPEYMLWDNYVNETTREKNSIYEKVSLFKICSVAIFTNSPSLGTSLVAEWVDLLAKSTQYVQRLLKGDLDGMIFAYIVSHTLRHAQQIVPCKSPYEVHCKQWHENPYSLNWSSHIPYNTTVVQRIWLLVIMWAVMQGESSFWSLLALKWQKLD